MNEGEVIDFETFLKILLYLRGQDMLNEYGLGYADALDHLWRGKLATSEDIERLYGRLKLKEKKEGGGSSE